MQEHLEERIRAAHAAGDHQGAATEAVEGYGPEVYGFLIASLRSEQDAEEVYAVLCEDLWRGLPGFEWHSSFRTWLYRIAHHAMARHLRAPERRRGRRVALSQISELAERVRSATAAHLRTESKDALSRVRQSLSPEERSLLTLRVDRRLAWREIAQVLAPEGVAPGELERESARLRKRFQLLKEEVARRMQREMES